MHMTPRTFWYKSLLSAWSWDISSELVTCKMYCQFDLYIKPTTFSALIYGYTTQTLQLLLLIGWFQKIYIPPQRMVTWFVPPPPPLSPRISSLALYFPFTNWAVETPTPTPLEFPLTILGVGKDIFWTCTLWGTVHLDVKGCLAFWTA